MNETSFYEKLEIFSDTVAACLSFVLQSHMLGDERVRKSFVDDNRLPECLYKQIRVHNKIAVIQYLYSLFDKNGFHLRSFLDEFPIFFQNAAVTDAAKNTLKLFEFIKNDVVIIRNNISSHSSYKKSGHKHGYDSLAKIYNFDIDLIVCFLRLIDTKFRGFYNSTKTTIPQREHREAMILEEIRRKIEHNSARSSFPQNELNEICQTVTADLTKRFYVNGIHPLYYPETGIALL